MKLLFCTAVKALHPLLSSNNASSLFFNSFLSSLAEFKHCIKPARNWPRLLMRLATGSTGKKRPDTPYTPSTAVPCSSQVTATTKAVNPRFPRVLPRSSQPCQALPQRGHLLSSRASGCSKLDLHPQEPWMQQGAPGRMLHPSALG